MLNFTDNSENETIQNESAKDTKIVINHKTKNIEFEFDYELETDRDNIRYFIDNYDIEEILKEKGLSYKKFKKFDADEDWNEIEEYSRVIADEIVELENKYNDLLLDFWEVCDQTCQMFPSYTSSYVEDPEEAYVEVIDFEDVVDWRNRRFSRNY